jgi:hypothetical protein
MVLDHASQPLHVKPFLDEFFESKTLQDAAHTVSGIDKLNSANVRMVAEDKRTEVLAIDPAP